VIADVQYADQDDYGSRRYRASLEKLRNIIGSIEKYNLDFVLQVGDLIDRGMSNFDPVLAVFEELTIPVYHILGNHDFAVRAKEIDDVVHRLGRSRRYYDFGVRGWRFVILDGSDISTFANAENSEEFNEAMSLRSSLEIAGSRNANPWNGGIGINQVAWLTEVLEKSRAIGENVAIVCHFPLITSDCRHTLLNSRQIRSLLRRYDHVALFLSGHDHQGHYSKLERVHHVTVKGIVEGNAEPWSIFTFSDSDIEITGFDTETSKTLHVTC